MKFCTGCGSKVPDNMMFCPTCGARVESGTFTQQFTLQTESTADPEHIVSCKVETAEVSYDGARIKSKGIVHLTEGMNTFYIKGLPQEISAASVRLRVSGCPNSRFGVPASTLINVPEDDTEAIAALEREIELLDMQEELYRTNAVFTNRTNVTMAESLCYLEELPKRLQDIDAERKAKKKELAERKEKISENRIFLMPVEAECGKEGTYAFELSYTTGGVYWMPFYEIYAGTDEKVLFQLKGTVHQAMEEDWENCTLTLAAGSINQSGTLPELKPYIFYGKSAPTYPQRTFGASRMRANASIMADKDMAKAAAPAEAGAVIDETDETAQVPVFTAEIREETTVKYELPGTWHIARVGKGSVVGIHTFEAQADYRYETVPKKDETAYMMAEIKDVKQLHLMNCTAYVYQNDIYVGETEIRTDQEESFKLTLGRDDRIAISRRETDVQHSTSLFKNTQTQVYSYEINVENKNTEPADITVHDQYPLSRSTEITVEPGDLSGADSNEKTGHLTWNIKLAPGEKKTITFGYTVTWPKGTRLA